MCGATFSPQLNIAEAGENRRHLRRFSLDLRGGFLGHKLAIPRFARRTTPAPLLHAELSRRVQSLPRQSVAEPAFHDNDRQILQNLPASPFSPERQRACSDIPSANMRFR